MSSDIHVRSYKVGFGDCTLVSFPDGAVERHMLIDFGSVPGPAGNHDRFRAIAENIRDRTGGHIDVVVLTHEHCDHLNGFHAQKEVFDTMQIDSVWMGAPSLPEYEKEYGEWYDGWFKDKLPWLLGLRGLRDSLRRYNDSVKSRQVKLSRSMQTVIDNNLPSAEQLDYVRGLPKDPSRVQYLYHDTDSDMEFTSPFSSKVKVHFLAPELDECVYFEDCFDWSYLTLLRNILASVGSTRPNDRWQFPKERPKMSKTPQNLMTPEWNRLKAAISDNSPEPICQIDSNTNNVSLAFTLEVCGKRLLFAGDAGAASWAWIQHHHDAKTTPGDVLKPVQFLKVPNHGSQNCIPDTLLDTLLPKSKKQSAKAVVSTRSNVYGTPEMIPNRKLLTSLKERCELLSTETDGEALWVDVSL